MLDRRQSARDKVIYGGVAEIGERGATRDCVVRNIREQGAKIEFSNVIKLPKKQISLTIARKGAPSSPGSSGGATISSAWPSTRTPHPSYPSPILRSGCARASRKSDSCSTASTSFWAKAEIDAPDNSAGPIY